jgi:putative radical SAM enzyme (TIGR03279 family)
MLSNKRVERVEPGSIADELEIGTGDEIIALNDAPLMDILDWHLAESSEEIVLTVRHKNGELVAYEIEKDYDERLGIIFTSPTLDKIRACQNRCVFCFVDQMPGEMRETLYIKDDDYRLSFLSGSYITLTNLREEDITRITGLHLSPLYVSVHTTNPELRQKMMHNRRAGDVLTLLTRLADAGISFHTQIVLCPGLNDGDELEKTITDLYHLYPAVQTLAVVPVGLTGHREGLYGLSPVDGAHARDVLMQIGQWQNKCLSEQGTRFVYASDEFFTTAGEAIPPEEDYEGYPQLENGVGLVRLMLNEWEQWQKHLPATMKIDKAATIATGISASRYLRPIVDRLNQIPGLEVDLLPVENTFFGGRVTVAGLLTGTDLAAAISKKKPTGIVFLPSVMLREGKELFLDGYTIETLAQAAGAEIQVVDGLEQFLAALFDIEMR